MQTQQAVKTYLLSKKDGLKLSIFSFLADHPFFITKDYFADHFHLSEKNFMLYIQELENDLLSLDPTCQPIARKNRFLQLVLDEREIAYYYYRLFANYCERSTNFTIMTSLIKKKTNSVVSVSQQTNYSVSHVYSKIKVINKFLNLYGLSISFSKNGQKKITGTEIQIQYCMLDIYWNIFSNTSTLYQEDNKSAINSTLHTFFKKNLLQNLTNGMDEKLYLLLKICLTNFPVTSNKELKNTLDAHPIVNSFVHPDFDIMNNNIPISTEQRILINVLARLSLSKIETSRENYQQYQVLSKEQSPSFKHAVNLLEEFSSAFGLVIPEEQRILYTLNFLRNSIYAELFPASQPNTTTPSFYLYQGKQRKELTIAIASFYEQFVQEHSTTVANSQWILEDLLHLYDRYKAKKKVTIGINYTRDYYINDDLCSQIEQTFDKQSVILKKNDMEGCDIIISDCPIFTAAKETKFIYLLDSTITHEKMKTILRRLTDFIFERQKTMD